MEMLKNYNWRLSTNHTRSMWVSADRPIGRCIINPLREIVHIQSVSRRFRSSVPSGFKCPHCRILFVACLESQSCWSTQGYSVRVNVMIPSCKSLVKDCLLFVRRWTTVNDSMFNCSYVYTASSVGLELQRASSINSPNGNDDVIIFWNQFQLSMCA